jgi:cysteinyl-tRNA synthetase
MHCGMVNINSEKMSKSLGNIISIENAINNWGPNTIRILCLSTQYSKPLDYSDSNLSEALIKWKLVENCYYELKFPIDSSHRDNDFDVKDLSNKALANIKRYLDDDLNTPMALSEFMKFVSELNDDAAKEKITNETSRIVLPIFNQLLNIFGLKIIEPSEDEVKQITKMIDKRNKFRLEKNFKDADVIRTNLKEELNVELIDHKNNRTIWKKSEK